MTTWFPWIVLVLLVYLVFMVSSLQAQVASLNGSVGGPRTRQELEEAYKAGHIGRDQYERLKARMS